MEMMLQIMTKTRQNHRMRKRYWLITLGARTHMPCSSSIPGRIRVIRWNLDIKYKVWMKSV